MPVNSTDEISRVRPNNTDFTNHFESTRSYNDQPGTSCSNCYHNLRNYFHYDAKYGKAVKRIQLLQDKIVILRKHLSNNKKQLKVLKGKSKIRQIPKNYLTKVNGSLI